MIRNAVLFVQSFEAGTTVWYGPVPVMTGPACASIIEWCYARGAFSPIKISVTFVICTKKGYNLEIMRKTTLGKSSNRSLRKFKFLAKVS